MSRAIHLLDRISHASAHMQRVRRTSYKFDNVNIDDSGCIYACRLISYFENTFQLTRRFAMNPREERNRRGWAD